MRKEILAASLLIVAIQAHAEPPWRAAARACDEWAEAHICSMQADCPSWQWIAGCTIEQAYGTPGTMPPDAKMRFNWCVRQTEMARLRVHMAAAAGTPVDDAISCTFGVRP